MVDVRRHHSLRTPAGVRLKWDGLSGHPMGGHARLLALGLVLVLTVGLFAPFAPAMELDADTVEMRSGGSGVVDVPNWRIGDSWTYDGSFDVAGLIAAGGVSASVNSLTGPLTMSVTDIDEEELEGHDSLVYEVRGSGTFSGQATLDGYSGPLEVDYDETDIIRVSDLAMVERVMSLYVKFYPGGLGAIVYPNGLEIADIDITTEYDPPKENYDFPLTVGESHIATTSSTVSWSGDSSYFEMPEDETTTDSTKYTIIGTGDPGVSYSGCANAYNVTGFNATTSAVTGFDWYCPAVKWDAWKHIEDSIGLVIDFKLNAHSPASRTRIIDVDLEYPAWALDANLSAWLNVTDAGGTPVGGETLEFRYESTDDVGTVTTAANGSAHVIFNTGSATDPSTTLYDYASHGVIAWIPGSEQIGVSTLTLDENLVEVDHLTTATGVSITRTRDGASTVLNPLDGFSAVPGDDLTFSVPVRNRGILSAPPTQLEITAPDGSTSRSSVPALGAFSEARVDVSWTVPASQAIGDVTLAFEVDPDQLVTNDANRSNNADSLSLFIGRLPTVVLASVVPSLTYVALPLDATQSYDEDGGDPLCIYDIEDTDGSWVHRETPTCDLTWRWTDEGAYDVNLTLLDDEGDTVSTQIAVSILNRAPVVNLTASDTHVMVGDRITFSAADSSDIDTQNPDAPFAMLWQPPAAPHNQPYPCEEGLVTQTCTVTPEVEGQFTMSFRAIDDDGASTQVSHSVAVTNIAPHDGSMGLRTAEGEVLEADSQQVWHVTEDQALELFGTVTDSPNDMSSLRWEWQPDLDVDPSWHEVTHGAAPSLPVTWSEAGLHVIALQVFDDDEESSGVISGWVRVANAPPVIESFEAPLPLWEDARTLYTATYTDTASDLESLVACWDLDPAVDSDQAGSADDDCDIEGATLNHRWGADGVYSVLFHVTDDDGDMASQMLNFTVRNRKPTADVWMSTTTPVEGQMFGLSGNLSSDTPSDREDLIYRWDLDTSVDADDDGDLANDIDEVGMEIWISIDSAGARGIRLMVSDESQTATMDVTVEVAAEETGFFAFLSFEDGGVTTIVILLMVVLAGLLGVLAFTGRRGGPSSDPWEQVAAFDMGQEGAPAPMAAPAATMFAAPVEPTPEPAATEAVPAMAEPGPAGPPVPAEGLPPGWTEEQWTHYGAQWLAQEAAKTVEPTPPTFTSAEGDLDLDF